MIVMSQLRRIAVIVPHAEDEVTGCGSLLARSASTEASTYVVFVTVDDLRMRYDGSNATYREQISEIDAVAQLLGFSWEILFDNQGLTHKLDTVLHREMSELFEAIFHDCRPDLLLLPTAGADSDDQGVCLAGLASARWVVPQVLGYEHTVLRLAFGTDPSFSAFIGISEQINVKLEALTFYKSMSAPSPDIRSIRALARLRGAQIDLPAPKRFMSFVPFYSFIKINARL